MPEKIVIGSRGSKLALTQSRWVADELRRFHPGLQVEIVEIRTTGDKNLGVSLSAFGGKGAFTKELEDAILAGTCDIAVHSLKDLPTTLPAGLRVLCTPVREDTSDLLIMRESRTLKSLSKGAIIGSSSLRRRAQLARLRPDLKMIEFRGNVDTRLRKLRDGVADACILAAAGIRRLGLLWYTSAELLVDGFTAQPLIPPDWLPAAGQAALGIEGRALDDRVARLLAPLHDPGTFAATAAERAFLSKLGVGCQAPVAALAEPGDGRKLRLTGRILSTDGKTLVHRDATGSMDEPEDLGEAVARACQRAGSRKLI
jgi:hydroxymethylbilane synthase